MNRSTAAGIGPVALFSLSDCGILPPTIGKLFHRGIIADPVNLGF
jgi:hypothetical protein